MRNILGPLSSPLLIKFIVLGHPKYHTEFSCSLGNRRGKAGVGEWNASRTAEGRHSRLGNPWKAGMEIVERTKEVVCG